MRRKSKLLQALPLAFFHYVLGSLAGRGSWVGAVRKQESAAAPINLCVLVLLGLCHVGGAFGAGFPPLAAC